MVISAFTKSNSLCGKFERKIGHHALYYAECWVINRASMQSIMVRVEWYIGHRISLLCGELRGKKKGIHAVHYGESWVVYRASTQSIVRRVEGYKGHPCSPLCQDLNSKRAANQSLLRRFENWIALPPSPLYEELSSKKGSHEQWSVGWRVEHLKYWLVICQIFLKT